MVVRLPSIMKIFPLARSTRHREKNTGPPIVVQSTRASNKTYLFTRLNDKIQKATGIKHALRMQSTPCIRDLPCKFYLDEMTDFATWITTIRVIVRDKRIAWIDAVPEISIDAINLRQSYTAERTASSTEAVVNLLGLKELRENGM